MNDVSKMSEIFRARAFLWEFVVEIFAQGLAGLVGPGGVSIGSREKVFMEEFPGIRGLSMEISFGNQAPATGPQVLKRYRDLSQTAEKYDNSEHDTFEALGKVELLHRSPDQRAILHLETVGETTRLDLSSVDYAQNGTSISESFSTSKDRPDVISYSRQEKVQEHTNVAHHYEIDARGNVLSRDSQSWDPTKGNRTRVSLPKDPARKMIRLAPSNLDGVQKAFANKAAGTGKIVSEVDSSAQPLESTLCLNDENRFMWQQFYEKSPLAECQQDLGGKFLEAFPLGSSEVSSHIYERAGVWGCDQSTQLAGGGSFLSKASCGEDRMIDRSLSLQLGSAHLNKISEGFPDFLPSQSHEPLRQLFDSTQHVEWKSGTITSKDRSGAGSESWDCEFESDDLKVSLDSFAGVSAEFSPQGIAQAYGIDSVAKDLDAHLGSHSEALREGRYALAPSSISSDEGRVTLNLDSRGSGWISGSETFQNGECTSADWKVSASRMQETDDSPQSFALKEALAESRVLEMDCFPQAGEYTIHSKRHGQDVKTTVVALLSGGEEFSVEVLRSPTSTRATLSHSRSESAEAVAEAYADRGIPCQW